MNVTGPMVMFMVPIVELGLHGRVVNHGQPFHRVWDTEAASFDCGCA